jgi:flagellar protein FliS
MTPTEMTYRQTAVEGASGFGLLIALYDTLAGDLRRAAQAQRRKDIQSRVKEVNHALLVLGFLQDWTEREGSGELAAQLLAFYTRLRGTLLVAQAKQSAEMIEEQMRETLKIREIWQRLEDSAPAEAQRASSFGEMQLAGMTSSHEETSSMSWSA